MSSVAQPMEIFPGSSFLLESLFTPESAELRMKLEALQKLNQKANEATRV